MKKLSAYVLFLLLWVFSANTMAKLQVFACEPEWAALTRALGGDAVVVISATMYRQDPHHIQARPSLIARIRRADLLVCTGADLEIGWLPLLLRKSSNPRIQPGQAGYLMAAQQVSLLEKPQIIDRSMGDIHAAGNPHIQFDPDRIAVVARVLSKRLIQLDGAHQQQYEKAAQQFQKQWNQLIQQWKQKVRVLQGKTYVAYHQGWAYLAKWLQLRRLAVLEPKPGIPPTAAHLSEVLARVKNNPPDVIIYASYQSNKAADWLARKTGKKAIAIPFSVPPGQTLAQWYEQVLQRLIEGVQ